VTIARQELGRHAERLVADALERAGARVLDRNVRVRGIRGELDLVATEGRRLVFVEVKALRDSSTRGPERPALSVGHRKRAKLRALARAFLAERRGQLPRFDSIRFDVVGLRLDARGRVTEWEHIRGAF
jgi:putative endonuclease